MYDFNIDSWKVKIDSRFLDSVTVLIQKLLLVVPEDAAKDL